MYETPVFLCNSIIFIHSQMTRILRKNNSENYKTHLNTYQRKNIFLLSVYICRLTPHQTICFYCNSVDECLL